jgi:hypothetical protein
VPSRGTTRFARASLGHVMEGSASISLSPRRPRSPRSLPLCRGEWAMAGHPRPMRRGSGLTTATRCVIPRTHRWAGAATPTQRNTTHAQDRARRASDVINISNFISEDNPPRPPGGAAGRLTSAGATRAASRSAGARDGDARARFPDTWTRIRDTWTRIRNAVTVVAWALAGWVSSIPRRWLDRLFEMNDAEAYWRGWQIVKVRGGLGRRYRDPRFDTLAACSRCGGAGSRAGRPCSPCLGTGRARTEADWLTREVS